MLVYPGLTALDLVGPQTFLAGLAPGSLHLVGAEPGPVTSDTGLVLVATHGFATCPADLDVLFVPGGDGTPAQMGDAALLAFLRDRAARAGWIASVCTGSLILGAAGLLRGYRATSHWSVRDAVLPLLGARPVAERVVFDRDRVTAAGVSAGSISGWRSPRACAGIPTPAPRSSSPSTPRRRPSAPARPPRPGPRPSGRPRRSSRRW